MRAWKRPEIPQLPGRSGAPWLHDTATAALILSLHVEYVRELIRRGILRGAKHNNEYEIKLADVMDFMSSSRYRAIGGPSTFGRGALGRFGPIRRMPGIDPQPGEEPGSAV